MYVYIDVMKLNLIILLMKLSNWALSIDKNHYGSVIIFPVMDEYELIIPKCLCFIFDFPKLVTLNVEKLRNSTLQSLFPVPKK